MQHLRHEPDQTVQTLGHGNEKSKGRTDALEKLQVQPICRIDPVAKSLPSCTRSCGDGVTVSSLEMAHTADNLSAWNIDIRHGRRCRSSQLLNGDTTGVFERGGGMPLLGSIREEKD